MGPPGWIPAAVKNQCGKSSGLVIAHSTTDPALSAGSFQVGPYRSQKNPKNFRFKIAMYGSE